MNDTRPSLNFDLLASPAFGSWSLLAPWPLLQIEKTLAQAGPIFQDQVNSWGGPKIFLEELRWVGGVNGAALFPRGCSLVLRKI
jgi:hypothetical protein